MTDDEYALLDELYFVIAYDQLKQAVGWPDAKVRDVLQALFDKGWVRVFHSPDHAADVESLARVDLEKSYFLASKTGLQAHNSN
jgi:hypothetical protein